MATPHPRRFLLIGALLFWSLLAGGCRSSNPDPLEKVNRGIYKFNDGVDRIVLKPATKVYEKVFPRFMRDGLANAFDNLGYGNVILNDFLQGRFGEGLGSMGRMAVNTTVGLAGTMDPATKWGLEAHPNDFGITLGKWGFGAGPYLVLPILGPSTARDAPNIIVRRFTNPLYYMDLEPEITIPLDVLQILTGRSRADAAIQFRDDAAIDPYIFVREAYLQRRRILIGEQPPATEDDFYEVDMPPSTRPTTRPATEPVVFEGPMGR